MLLVRKDKFNHMATETAIIVSIAVRNTNYLKPTQSWINNNF